MATIRSNPDMITITQTGDQYIIMPDLKEDKLVAKLTVVSGSVKFNTLGVASLSNITYTDGESVTVTQLPGKWISFNGSIGDTFTVAI